MDLKSAFCNRQTIEQFLADQLSDQDRAAFEDHLETCPSCRQGLDHMAAEGSWWEEARGYLSSSGEAEAGQGTGMEAAAEEVQPALCGLESYLGPTDDPRMLGRLGGYEIAGIVGSGGMGIVLKGFDAPLNRYVAIKVLGPQMAMSAAARQRFAREAKAAAAVVHDNVMAIHAVAEANGLPYIVMPYVRGPSLEKRLRQTGALGVVEVLRIGMQIAKGLAAAHAQGLVHRDIKPANILLEEGIERVTITDFGLARAVDDVSLTQPGVVAGTPQ
jgi:serine/threonine-protein kinase